MSGTTVIVYYMHVQHILLSQSVSPHFYSDSMHIIYKLSVLNGVLASIWQCPTISGFLSSWEKLFARSLNYLWRYLYPILWTDPQPTAIFPLWRSIPNNHYVDMCIQVRFLPFWPDSFSFVMAFAKVCQSSKYNNMGLYLVYICLSTINTVGALDTITNKYNRTRCEIHNIYPSRHMPTTV